MKPVSGNPTSPSVTSFRSGMRPGDLVLSRIVAGVFLGGDFWPPGAAPRFEVGLGSLAVVLSSDRQCDDWWVVLLTCGTVVTAWSGDWVTV